MAKVDITVNGRSFAVGCEPGQEDHLKTLARHFDGHVSRLAERVGQIGDLRLFLMAALVVSDELAEAAKENAALKDEGGAKDDDGDGGKAAEALINAAERIEALADRADKTP